MSLTLTSDQSKALELAKKFSSIESEEKVMILRGSAGTGKTTLLKYIHYELESKFDNVAVCAPTNKAARVIHQKTGIHAGTIHKLLFRFEEDAEGVLQIKRNIPNAEKTVLIIADEASMIGDRSEASESIFGNVHLLSELLNFLSQCAAGSRLLFVGDPCQLPPVGYENHENSPALDKQYLERTKGWKVVLAELRETMRQVADSYILEGATSLRNHLLYGEQHYSVNPRFLPGTTATIRKYLEHYDMDDDSKMMKIAWTNKDVNWWNRTMRERLDLTAAPLMPGTKVLIDRSRAEGEKLIPKGETAHIFEVGDKVQEFAGLNFLPVSVMVIDEHGVVTAEQKALALLEYLASDRGALADDQEKHLKKEALRCNEKYRETKLVGDDPYMNALRLRYAYALTCHKAQGSEYENVIVHPHQPTGDLRWLYTAITRAKTELYTY